MLSSERGDKLKKIEENFARKATGYKTCTS